MRLSKPDSPPASWCYPGSTLPAHNKWSCQTCVRGHAQVGWPVHKPHRGITSLEHGLLPRPIELRRATDGGLQNRRQRGGHPGARAIFRRPRRVVPTCALHEGQQDRLRSVVVAIEVASRPPQSFRNPMCHGRPRIPSKGFSQIPSLPPWSSEPISLAGPVHQ